MEHNPPAQTVEAERFVLRDRQGNQRALLETRPDGAPRLALRDKDGKDRVELLVAADGAPILNFLDRGGAIRLGLLVAADGEPDLNFADHEGDIRLNLGVARSGAPEVGLLEKDQRNGVMLTLTPHGAFVLDFDRDGKSLLALCASPDGSSALQFLDKAETPRLVLGLSGGDTPMVGSLDSSGKVRVGIATAPDGGVSLECCDAAGRLRLRLTVSPDGQPSLLVLDEHGKVLDHAGSGAAALLKAGAAGVPRIIEAMQNLRKLWALAEPLL
jgi:hypothetical protein